MCRKKKKTLLLRSKKKLLNFFWTDRFREFFLVPVTPTSSSRPTAGSSGHWIAWLPPFNKVLINRSQSSAHKRTLQHQLRVLHFTLWSDDMQLQLLSAHFRQHVCVLVPCSLWSVESCQRVCSLTSILIEKYMYVHVYVYVYGCLNISVPVSVHAHACVSGYLFACAYRRVTVTQLSAARPSRQIGLAFPRSSQASTSQAGLCGQHGTRGLRGMSIWHSGHGRHAQRRRSPPPCCGWCMFCFCDVLLRLCAYC